MMTCWSRPGGFIIKAHRNGFAFRPKLRLAWNYQDAWWEWLGIFGADKIYLGRISSLTLAEAIEIYLRELKAKGWQFSQYRNY
jgi:hypothetical protein